MIVSNLLSGCISHPSGISPNSDSTISSGNSAAVAAQALPGQWNAASGTYTVTDASRAAMQTFFNVSPTEAQASSFSEP